MHYQFPKVSHIDPFLKAIDGSDEFIVKRDSVSDSQEAYNAALRRECRGIEFDIETGDLVTRKYAKFFNVNQTPETQMHAIDWSQPHWILEKLDGSMITPFRKNDGNIQWHTKMGYTEVSLPVNKFVETHPEYIKFAHYCIDNGWTPIFEWCSRQQKIVIDYPEEKLILTAIRDNVSGEYLPY
jgi:tRNA splicing ligase